MEDEEGTLVKRSKVLRHISDKIISNKLAIGLIEPFKHLPSYTDCKENTGGINMLPMEVKHVLFYCVVNARLLLREINVGSSRHSFPGFHKNILRLPRR